MKTIDKMKMIRIAMMITLVLSSATLFAQSSGELNVPLSKPGSRAMIKIDINKGSITLKGTSRQDVMIKYTAREKNKDKSSKTSNGLTRISSSGLDLEAYERDNTVKVSSDSWNKGVDLVIEVPTNVDLDVSTYNSGDIEIENIVGEVVAENYNGRITLMNVSGSAVADTYNGRIKVLFNEVTAATPMSFTTYNGDIDITFPAGTKGNLKMKTARGEIYSGFDMAVMESAPVQKKDEKNGVYKVYLDEWTHATINGGGPEITLKNYNGDIYIRTK